MTMHNEIYLPLPFPTLSCFLSPSSSPLLPLFSSLLLSSLPSSLLLSQMFPMALVCGNTYVIKPSEQDPGACMMLVKMAQEAGVPDGVVNVIHGQKECKSWLWLETIPLFPIFQLQTMLTSLVLRL